MTAHKAMLIGQAAAFMKEARAIKQAGGASYSIKAWVQMARQTVRAARRMR